MRSVSIILLCFLFCVSVFGDVYDPVSLESARLGSATYNISIQFLQDEIAELTPIERHKRIDELSDKYKKKNLTPLRTLDLLRLLSKEKRVDEEKKLAEEFDSNLKSILSEEPKDHEALIATMKLDQWYGEKTVLKTLLADTTIADNTYKELLLELVNVHLAYGNYEKAETIVDHILKFDSLDTEVLVTKTLIRSTSWMFRLLNNDLQLFVEELTQIPKEKQMDMTVARAEAIFDSIDFTPVHRALKMDPDNFQYNCFIGSIQEFVIYLHYIMLMSSNGEEEGIPALSSKKMESLQTIKSYLKTALENKPPGDIDVFMALAMYHLVLLDFENARRYAEEAIEARPDLDQTYDALITIVNFQKILVEEDEEAGLTESISILQEKSKKMSLTLTDRLMFLHPMINKKQYQMVLEELDEIEKDFQDQESTLKLFRGGVFLRLGSVNEALSVLEEVLVLEPNNVDIQYNLGLAYFAQQDLDKALMFLNKALQIDPSDKEIQDLIEKVKAKQK